MTEVANKPADNVEKASLNAGQGSHDDNLQQFRTQGKDQRPLPAEAQGVGQDFPKLALTQDSDGTYRWQPLPAKQPDFNQERFQDMQDSAFGKRPEFDPERFQASQEAAFGKGAEFDPERFQAMQDAAFGKRPEFNPERFQSMQDSLPGKATKFDQARFDAMQASIQGSSPEFNSQRSFPSW